MRCYLGSFQSGQMGQTVNLLAQPSKVRILHSPLAVQVTLYRFFYVLAANVTVENKRFGMQKLGEIDVITNDIIFQKRGHVPTFAEYADGQDNPGSCGMLYHAHAGTPLCYREKDKRH